MIIHIVRVSFALWVLASVILSFIYFNGNDSSLVIVSSSRAEVHVVYYFMGAFLFFHSFRFEGMGFVIFAGTSVFLLGVILEVVQIWVPHRTFNPLDIAANGAGVGLFVILRLILFKRR